MALPVPANRMRQGEIANPSGKLTICQLPVILQPSGMVGVLVEIVGGNVMMLAPDHPTRAAKLALDVVRAAFGVEIIKVYLTCFCSPTLRLTFAVASAFNSPAHPRRGGTWNTKFMTTRVSWFASHYTGHFYPCKLTIG